MKEKIRNQIIDHEQLSIDKEVEKFKDPKIPYKIRKTQLLENFNLPIPETEYFKREDIVNLKNRTIERIKLSTDPLIIRVACIPDKLSMPFFYVESNEINISHIIREVGSLLDQDGSIVSLILQDATPKEKISDKISGRISFESEKMIPVEQFLEIYKGSRSTGILNNLSKRDPQFMRFVKEAGHFMRPETEFNGKSTITKLEIKDLYNLLESYKEKMENVKQVIAKSLDKLEKETLVVFEFSYRNGEIIFTDFD